MFCCLRTEVDVDGVVVSVAHCAQTGTVALQLEDGQIRKLLWGQSSAAVSLVNSQPPRRFYRILCFFVSFRLSFPFLTLCKTFFFFYFLCRLS